MKTLAVICLVVSSCLALVDDAGNIGAGAMPGIPVLSGPSLPDLHWETKTAMPTARKGLAVAAVGNLMYCVSGYTNTRVTMNEVYDAVGNSWTTRASASFARIGCAGAAVNGKVYVVGGYDGANYLSVVEEYDPAGDSWHTCPPMTYGRTTPAAVGLGGKLYCMGGFTGSAYPTLVERYDPSTQTWDTVAPLPTGRTGLDATVLNGRIYTFGGWIGHEPMLTTVEVYDPGANSWSTLQSMPTGRMYPEAVALGGYLFVMGGFTVFGGGYTDVVEALDTLTGQWSTSTPMLIPRGMFGATEIGGKAYAVGGSYQGTPLSENDQAEIVTGLADASLGPNALQPGLSASPNPFRKATTIRYSALPPAPWPQVPALVILDLAGRKVRALVPTGSGSLTWDGTDASGCPVTAGIYFCRAFSDKPSPVLRLALMP